MSRDVIEALGFPLPAGAADKGAAPGGDGKILVFEVPRARDQGVQELRELLQDGWRLDSAEASPSGNAIRMRASRAQLTVMARLVGDDERTSLILTLP